MSDKKETKTLEPTTLSRLESIDGTHVVFARSAEHALVALNDHYAWMRFKQPAGIEEV